MSVRTAALMTTALFVAPMAFADVVPPKADTGAPAEAPALPDSTAPTTAPDASVPSLSDPTKPEAEAEKPSPQDAAANSLVLRDGTHELSNGKARVTIADGFAYLDEADTRKLLTEVWGNPPDAVGNVLGAIVPKDVSVLAEGSWAAIITYEDDGHVADDDAKSIDYTQLMKDMKEGMAEDNEARKKAGYDAVTLVGWAQEPKYDANSHKLYWAKHLKFGAESDTLNYAIRALGRDGVLQVNVVSSMDQLKSIDGKVPGLLSMVSFTDGNRYADYKEGDKLAAYGLAGLIAGGVAAKAGLFKGLIALWKPIMLGLAAFGAAIWRFFGRLFGRSSDGPTS